MDNFEGDVDTLPPMHFSGLTGDHRQIKNRFEALFTEQVLSITGEASMEAYTDAAYGTGRWLRRIWRFAQHGFNSNHQDYLLRMLEKEWTETYGYACLKPAYSDDEDAGESEASDESIEHASHSDEEEVTESVSTLSLDQ